MDDGELLRLAREGDAWRAEAAARQEQDERLERIRQRREVRRLGLSDLLEAVGDDASNRLRMVGVVAAFGVLWMVGLALGWERVSTAGLAGLIVIPFLYFPLQRWLALCALRRERAWLRSLPFPVRGYFALLSQTPAEERSATLRFRLADEGPDEDVVRGLAGRSGGAVRVTRRRGGWEVESGTISSPAFDERGPDNAPLRGWMRAVLVETLLPLHATHRVVSARFRG